jgi:hypothetical protein
MLVAPDVDALCSARMLADLFKQDDLMHRVVPVSGIAELENIRDELMSYSEVCVNRARSPCYLTEYWPVAYTYFIEHGGHP